MNPKISFISFDTSFDTSPIVETASFHAAPLHSQQTVPLSYSQYTHTVRLQHGHSYSTYPITRCLTLNKFIN